MTTSSDAPTGRTPLPIGTRIEVRTGFDGSWSTGFVVETHTPTGYRLRRRSDDEVLPVELAAEAVRRERKNSMWWY